MPRIKKPTTPAVRQQAQAPAQEQFDTDQKADGRSGRFYVRDRVLKAIENGAGNTVYANDIVSDLDVPLNTVQAAARALTEQVPQVEAVIPARAWRWVSKASKGKRMFEELTTTKAGVVLVQDEDGNVYKLEEL